MMRRWLLTTASFGPTSREVAPASTGRSSCRRSPIRRMPRSGVAGRRFQVAQATCSRIAVSVWPDGSVRIYAQQVARGNAIYNWYSNDSRASWNFPGAIVSPPGGALCKGIGSAGNNDVFFIYDVAGGENLGACFYSGGAWGSLHAWTLPVLSYGAGCDAAWNGSVYTIVYSDSYTLSSCTYNPNTNAWSAGSVIAPATSTAVGRLAPRLQYFNGVYWLICIESDTGALTGTVYSYPRVRQSSDLI